MFRAGDGGSSKDARGAAAFRDDSLTRRVSFRSCLVEAVEVKPE